MLINEKQLKHELNLILKTKTKNSIVRTIKSNGHKFHFFQLTNFLEGKDVSLSTLKKLDEYISAV